MGLFNGTLMLKSVDILEKGLDSSLVRREVLANNIANADVPGFKRSDVVFEAELKRALDSEKDVENVPLLRTNHSMHTSRREPIDYRQVRPGVHTDYNSTMRNDGNNVDIESEISAVVKNQMSYSLMVDRIGADFRLMNSLIRMA